MDKIDQKLLSLLQENARYPLKYLASQVYLSSPAVSARIERLEKAGIISGYHAYIEPLSVGYHIKAYINMTLDPKQKEEFYPFIESCPNVLECDCVTGAFSMHMKVWFPSTMELDSFIGRLQTYGKTETQIVFSTPVPSRGVDVTHLPGQVLTSDEDLTDPSETEE
ncbi:MAG: Lrp/AsnC family transcriptional regulator [Eubacterium sp.]|nr:Lrp/AsnC family transcriptional regulator [Eubacterium sp.]